MADKRFLNRIPFEEIQSAAIWSLPALDNGAKVVPSVKKKHNSNDPQSHERIEDVAASEVKPVTAEHLQKMTELVEQEARELGYQEGLQKGFAEGSEQGRKQGEQKAYSECKASLEDKTRLFRELADALMDPVAMQDDGLENWIIDTAVQLAKHLINRELTEDPSALFHIIERAVTSLPAGASNIRVYLHADDVELAHEAFADTGQQWRFYGDPQLSRGGCRVVSEQSLVDYSVENRLQKMLEEVNFQGEVNGNLDDEPPSYRPVDEVVTVPQPVPDHLDDEDDHPAAESWDEIAKDE